MRRTATYNFFVLGVIALAGCSGSGDTLDDAPQTFNGAKQRAAERGATLVIDFYTDW